MHPHDARPWQARKLGDVCTINPSKTEVRGWSGDLDVSFVPMAAVNEATGVFGRPEVRKLGQVSKGYTYFREGDVLFAKITPCMENGKATVARGLVNGLGFGSTEFHVLRPREAVLPEWVFYWVRRPLFREQAAASFTGSVGQQRVPDWFLSEHEIPVPPLEEQRRIVGRIEALAERIERAKGLRRAACQEAEALLPAALAEVFANDRDGRWSRQTLGEISDIRGGIQKTPDRRPRENPRPYLRVANVLRNRIDISDLAYFEVTDAELSRWRVEPGDVLIIEGNGSSQQIGRAALFRGEVADCVHQNHIIRVRPHESVALGDYLNAYLNSAPGQDEVQRRSVTTSGLRSLSVSKIRSIEVALPPLKEQQRIIAYLDSVRAKAEQLQRLQAETQAELGALLPSVLDRAFRGEL